MAIRHVAALVFGLVLAALAAAAAPASATTILRASADKIAFYFDRFTIKADGNVRLSLDATTDVAAQTLIIDLRSNQLIAAGGVRLNHGGLVQPGAALAIAYNDQRAYFISLSPAPERWTYEQLDFNQPKKGVPQPADAFVLPDLSDSVPIVLARKMTIGLRSFMRFGSCRVAPLGGVAIYVPLPSLYVNFSKDPNMVQTTLGAATVGAKIKLTGSTNASTALALNYSSTTKFGVGFEQNAVWQKGWGALSVFPINQKAPFFSAIVTDAPSQNFGLQASALVNSYPSGDSLPASAAQFSYFQVTQSLHDAYLQLNYQLGSSDLLAPPPIEAAYGNAPRFGPTHPSSVQLGLSSSTFHLASVLDGYVRGGYVYNHNGDGLQQFGGVTYSTIWSPYAGLSFATPQLHLGSSGRWSPYLVLQATGQREWNSLPHHVDQAMTGATLTQPLPIGWLTAAYRISNVKDVYGAAQREAYPIVAPAEDPGYAAFQGYATLRSVSLGLVYAVTPYVALSVTGEHHDDFPLASPVLFTPVQPTVLGVNPLPNYLGQPPYDLPVAARIRVNRSLSINLQGTYYFNYFGTRWNGVQLQFLP